MTSHYDVALNWAKQTGKGRRGFNVFYEGDTIYSYGYHFAIARITKTPSGQACVLFTTESYSVSTAKHKTIVYGAIKGGPLSLVPVFDTAFVDPKYGHNLPYYLRTTWEIRRGEIAKEIGKAERARVWTQYHVRCAHEIISSLNALNNAWRLGMPTLTFEPSNKLVEKLKGMEG